MTLKSKRLDWLFIIIGNVFIAVGVSSFTAPNGIAAGGLTGVATILYYIFGFQVGTVVLLLNIPIFLIAANKFGIKFLYYSIISTVIMTVFIDLSPKIVPVYKGDKVLSAVFGGILMGLGLALIFLRGATTGGVDILAKLMQGVLPQFSIGNLILLLDAVVIISSAIAYKSIENAFFAIISIFFQSKTIDYIIYGFDKGRLIIVKSDFCNQILQNATNHLHSVYTINSNENEIICATHRYEAAKFHKIVKNTDKSAFIVTIEAGEIFGEGFNNFNESS